MIMAPLARHTKICKKCPIIAMSDQSLTSMNDLKLADGQDPPSARVMEPDGDVPALERVRADQNQLSGKP